MTKSQLVFCLLPHLLAAGEGVAQCPVRHSPACPAGWCCAEALRLCVCACVTSHFVVERKRSTSQQTVLTVCHSVTSQPEHSLSGEIYRSINCLRDTTVSMLIVSPFIHNERLRHTCCRGGKLFPALASALQLHSLCLCFLTSKDYTSLIVAAAVSSFTYQALVFVLELHPNIFFL